MALQQNNLGPMGFGQPQRAERPLGQGYGQPGTPQPSQPQPTTKPTKSLAKAVLPGIPAAYSSLPADKAYKRIQHAIVNPSAMMPQQIPPPPPMPPMGMPPMGGPPPMAAPPGGIMPPGPPSAGAESTMEAAMAFMQNQLGGLR